MMKGEFLDEETLPHVLLSSLSHSPSLSLTHSEGMDKTGVREKNIFQKKSGKKRLIGKERKSEKESESERVT